MIDDDDNNVDDYDNDSDEDDDDDILNGAKEEDECSGVQGRKKRVKNTKVRSVVTTTKGINLPPRGRILLDFSEESVWL